MYCAKSGLLATALALLATWTMPVSADWIVLNGLTHEDVYINETRTMYFVHFPDTGEVMNVPKASVPVDHVGFHDTPEHRAALLDAWRESNPERERTADRREDMRIHQEKSRAVNPPVQFAPAASRRVKSLALGGDTLPKIVLRNPPLRTAQTGIRQPGAMMRQPRTQGFGGVTAGGMGMAGARGMNPMGAGGMGGGMGMMGGGMGMMGGGMGMVGARDVTAIGNISDLFFNIDDRLVGETPAEIHYSYMFHQPRGQVNNMRAANNRNRR